MANYTLVKSCIWNPNIWKVCALECEYLNNYTKHTTCKLVITCKDQRTKNNISSSNNFYLQMLLMPIMLVIVYECCIMTELTFLGIS